MFAYRKSSGYLVTLRRKSKENKYLCRFSGEPGECYLDGEVVIMGYGGGLNMKHMEYRQTVHAICDDFYAEIRGLDGSDESWKEIYRLKDAYHAKCGGSRLSEELIIAIVNEFERDLKGGCGRGR